MTRRRRTRGPSPVTATRTLYAGRGAEPEIEHGVRFWGFAQDGRLLGVMGLQDVEDVTLIRHAYVRTTHRRRGIGGRLLEDLRSRATRPLLVGTWAAADWAIKFYRQHGFEPVPRDPVPLPCCAAIGACPSARSRRPWCWRRKAGREAGQGLKTTLRDQVASAGLGQWNKVPATDRCQRRRFEGVSSAGGEGSARSY